MRNPSRMFSRRLTLVLALTLLTAGLGSSLPAQPLAPSALSTTPSESRSTAPQAPLDGNFLAFLAGEPADSPQGGFGCTWYRCEISCPSYPYWYSGYFTSLAECCSYSDAQGCTSTGTYSCANPETQITECPYW